MIGARQVPPDVHQGSQTLDLAVHGRAVEGEDVLVHAADSQQALPVPATPRFQTGPPRAHLDGEHDAHAAVAPYRDELVDAAVAIHGHDVEAPRGEQLRHAPVVRCHDLGKETRVHQGTDLAGDVLPEVAEVALHTRIERIPGAARAQLRQRSDHLAGQGLVMRGEVRQVLQPHHVADETVEAAAVEADGVVPLRRADHFAPAAAERPRPVRRGNGGIHDAIRRPAQARAEELLPAPPILEVVIDLARNGAGSQLLHPHHVQGREDVPCSVRKLQERPRLDAGHGLIEGTEHGLVVAVEAQGRADAAVGFVAVLGGLGVGVGDVPGRRPGLQCLAKEPEVQQGQPVGGLVVEDRLKPLSKVHLRRRSAGSAVPHSSRRSSR